MAEGGADYGQHAVVFDCCGSEMERLMLLHHARCVTLKMWYGEARTIIWVTFFGEHSERNL